MQDKYGWEISELSEIIKKDNSVWRFYILVGY